MGSSSDIDRNRDGEQIKREREKNKFSRPNKTSWWGWISGKAAGKQQQENTRYDNKQLELPFFLVLLEVIQMILSQYREKKCGPVVN